MRRRRLQGRSLDTIRGLASYGFIGVLALAACAPPMTPLSSTPTRSTPGTFTRDTQTVAGREESESSGSVGSTTLPAKPIVSSSRQTSWRTIRQVIDSLLDQPFYRTSTWGALVVNARGDTLYSRNAGKLLIPASNMKVVTAATALAQLGPDFVFQPNAVALVKYDTVPSDFGPMYDTTWLKNRPLRDVLSVMLKQSQNRLAEQIFKTVGVERTKSARRDSSIAVTQRQFAQWQVPSDGYIVYDGSGYDRMNYLSAETLVRILYVLRDDAVFVNAFPIAGVDGTLVRRMRATSATGNAYAKTGSLFSIRSLSGYLTTVSGERLIFSLICNAYTTPGTVVTATMDSVVARLSDMQTKP